MRSPREWLLQLEQRPNDELLLQKLGAHYQRVGDNETAATYFARLSELFVRDGVVFKAIALYKQVWRLNPTIPEVAARIGELHLMVQLTPESLEHFKAARAAFLTAGRRREAAEIEAKLAQLGAPVVSVPKARA